MYVSTVVNYLDAKRDVMKPSHDMFPCLSQPQRVDKTTYFALECAKTTAKPALAEPGMHGISLWLMVLPFESLSAGCRFTRSHPCHQKGLLSLWSREACVSVWAVAVRTARAHFSKTQPDS